MSVAAKTSTDGCCISLQIILRVDEGNRRLAANVAITDQVAEQAGALCGDGLHLTESAELARRTWPTRAD